MFLLQERNIFLYCLFYFVSPPLPPPVPPRVFYEQKDWNLTQDPKLVVRISYILPHLIHDVIHEHQVTRTIELSLVPIVHDYS